ncbi:MAG: SOS response-associated peptidase [Clostridiaceae bacterium]|jgi:putative SOS response-associated peptidase YedK|nr:SOS response-associated peptidase [Clostridiaceae bacterium]
MCGRYYIDPDESELIEIASKIGGPLLQSGEMRAMKTKGEIFPSNIVPVQMGIDLYKPMKWGFKGYDNRLIINARSETALEKPMFRDAMQYRRCLIPASGYYEWESVNGSKERYEFFLPAGPLFLAGCFREENDDPILTFVILTRQATPEFTHIHNRMPVIIPRSQMTSWLTEDANAISHSLTDLLFRKATAIIG